MEELFLRAVLAGEELDIVNHQRIDTAIARLECVDGGVSQRLDHLADEFFRVQIDDLEIRIALGQFVSYSVQQMGLAESSAAVQQQRVVRLAWILGDLLGRSESELVGFAEDEIAEMVAVIKAGIEPLAAACSCGRSRLFAVAAHDDLDVVLFEAAA